MPPLSPDLLDVQEEPAWYHLWHAATDDAASAATNTATTTITADTATTTIIASIVNTVNIALSQHCPH